VKLLCERGAGSGKKESREQELMFEYQKYVISTKNRNFKVEFFKKIIF
jgi:hypothetical protein